MTQHNPPHPGELLNELWLVPLGLSITAAAVTLKISRKTLSEIVNGKASVSAEMALRLELAFGKSAESWMAHQSAYDLWQLKKQRRRLGISRLAA